MTNLNGAQQVSGSDRDQVEQQLQRLESVVADSRLVVPDHLNRASTPPPPQPPPPPPPPPQPQQQQPINGTKPASSNTQQQPKPIKQILKLPSEQRSAMASQRKASVVSFQEKCEFREIDLERNLRKKKRPPGQPEKPAALVSLRYYIMLLALISPFVVTYSKTIINFAIIDMIHPDFVGQHKSNNTSTTNHNNATQQQQQTATLTASLGTADTSAAATTLPSVLVEGVATQEDQNAAYFDQDNSCPVSELDRERLLRDLKSDKRRAHERPGEKFEWDTVKQGMLKAAYSIGHSLCSVIGGRLAEIFGSHRIMGTSSLLIGFCCLLAPFFASIHFYLLFADLLLLGILGSFMTPALITLFANWLTPSEKSMMISFYLVSSRLGYALSSLLCGLLINAQLSWRYLFYSAGWISFIFAVLFMLLSRSRPSDHPFIGQLELDYLASKNMLVREQLAYKMEASSNETQKGDKMIEMRGSTASNGSTTAPDELKSYSEKKDIEKKVDADEANKQNNSRRKKGGAPWFAILTSVPVWAFITTKFCVKLAGDTVQIELPTYLNRVMHFSSKDNGFINSSNYVIFCLSCLLVGGLAKTANKRHPFGWSKTAIRKLFQSTASFGVSIVLLGISFSTCNNTMTLVCLMLMFFFTTFGTGGEAQIPLDISERYAGTIHAIGSSLAVSGAIEPILVGFLLRGHAADQNSWSTVWLGASGIAAFGGIVFLIFGDASKQDFDLIDPSTGKRFPDSVPTVAASAPTENNVAQEENGQQREQKKLTDGLLADGEEKKKNQSANGAAGDSYNESDQI